MPITKDVVVVEVTRIGSNKMVTPKEETASSCDKLQVSLLNGTIPRSSVAVGRDMLERLDNLFRYYHRRYWCHRQLYGKFKYINTLLNGAALLVAAVGIVVGNLLKESWLVTVLTALGVLIKGWIDFKKMGQKVNMSRFAFTSYEKILIELRTFARGVAPDTLDKFLVKQQVVEDVITDFSPPIVDSLLKRYDERVTYTSVHQRNEHGSTPV